VTGLDAPIQAMFDATNAEDSAAFVFKTSGGRITRMEITC
jgi:hypothetical protein